MFSALDDTWRLGPGRQLDEFLLYLVQSGSGWAKAAGVVYRLEPGDVLLLPPMAEHECKGYPNGAMALHHIRFRVWKGGEEITDLDLPRYIRHAEELRPWMASWIQEVESAGEWAECRISALFTLIYSQLQQIVSRQVSSKRMLSPGQCQRLERIVDKHIKYRPCAMDLAAELALSTQYFRSLFKNTYGQSVREWLVQRRMRLAAVMLTEGGMAVSEVAFALGYDSLSLFSRQFSNIHAMSPRSYKKLRG